ncbi:hypothetical protein L7F22_042184 [Adiantum nelumboides]|nr:hypothetical protein [Adiantum nelumboides]
MDDDNGAITQLGDLALGNLLTELGVEANNADVSRLVGGAKSRPTQLLEQDQIYNERYADDDIDLGDLPVDHSSGQQDEEVTTNGSTSYNREKYMRMGLDALSKSKSRIRGEDDDFDEDADAEGEEDESYDVPLNQQQQSQSIKVKEEPVDVVMQSPPSSPSEPTPPPALAPQPVDVKQLWPGFEEGAILNFTDLFTSAPRKRRKMIGKVPKIKELREEDIQAYKSTRDLLANEELMPSKRSPSHGLVYQLTATDDLDAERIRKEQHTLQTLTRPNQMLDASALDDWEDRIIWDDPVKEGEQPQQIVNINRPYNRELDQGDWLEGIIWDVNAPHKDYTQLLLDLNDPEMLLETKSGEEQEKSTSLLRSDAPAVSFRAARAAIGLDPFNLSNDRFYELSKEYRMKSIRQTLGQLELQHARPAVKLQMPFYKTRMSKQEARDFHRPVIHFPSNVPLRFSKVRKEKRKSKDEAKSRSKKDFTQLLKTTRDLTLKDTSSFILYEYTEEYPPVLSNLGMGSLLVNYYRKRDARDEHIPKSDLGETVVLDVSDESPFMKFGSVEPGRVQPTLYNRMIRAPLFRHKAAHNDFLLIRSTTKTEVRYYIRDIRNLFVVGQTYPLVPVPGPHARLVTNALKYRMQLITYKLLQKSIGERIKIHRIMKYFPDQNELQMRQRMKEFMEYHRRDKDQGYWKLKPDHVPPTEEDLQSRLTPEHVCLIEAMQAGQRHLLDAGYSKTAEGYEEENQDESQMDIEQLLAPWITTKNFMHATQGKAMLKLYGEGDPTGRGEAFSFLRVSMKDIFIRAGETEEERMAMQQMEEEKSGHKYNVARQQEVYKSEVQRIWNTQRKSLENPVPPKLTQAELEAAEAAEAEAAAGQQKEIANNMRAQNRAHSIRGGSPSGSQAGTPRPDDLESNADIGKVLRIRRYKNGRWNTEIVRETGVIHAYIRQRQRIEDERTATEALLPTGDAALDALRKKRLEDEIKSSLKNRDRRLQRKNAKALAEGLPIEGGAQALLNKTDTKRRCGRCGQIGHMMTNTSCPMFKAAQKDKGIDMGMQGVPAPGAMGGPGGPGHRPNMLPQTSWFGPSPAASVPQSPLTPGQGFMSPSTPATPGPAASPAGGAGSPPAENVGPKLKIKLNRGK